MKFNIIKIIKTIKIALTIMEHLEDTGLVKSGKVIKITNIAGAVVTTVSDKIPTPTQAFAQTAQ